MSGRKAASSGELTATTARAWERFVAGEDVTDGVRPEILLSWYRCRDHYSVDPARNRAPVADGGAPESADAHVAAAELGGAAMAIATDVDAIGGVVAVGDGAGRILASWGDRRTARRGREQNLGPLFAWTERATGTTGVGTALEAHSAVAVRGPEHWCSAFQDWSCAAVAIRDPVSAEPLGVLDISLWRRPLPAAALDWLRRSADGIEAGLRKRASRSLADLVTAFRHRERTTSGLALLDTGVRLLLADEEARRLLGLESSSEHKETLRRLKLDLPELEVVAREALARARRNPTWIGATDLPLPGLEVEVPVTVEPVLSQERIAGLLLAFNRAEGEPFSGARAEPAASPVRRLVGALGAKLLVVSPEEVRYVEVDRNDLWLETDRGRLRASIRGLDRLEAGLRGHGFFRVNRSTLVNLGRVREVAPAFKGGVWIGVDGARELIPVSRRRVASLRRALGF